MPYPTTRMQAQCPNCGQPVMLNVHQVVDVGDDPTQRDRLLRGRLNVLRCGRCGFSSPISSPMVYHDPAHSLMLAYVPQELNLTMPQEEKEIGRLSNLILNNTPAAQRKMYMLEPKRVLTYDALMEKILEAEGIDPQAMRKQAERVQLIVSLARLAATEPTKLDAALATHRDELDKDMVMMVTATMAQAAEMGDEALIQPYARLRDALIKALDLKPEDLTLTPEQARDQIIEVVQTLPDDDLAAFAEVNRPALDYAFFMHLATRIESATGEDKAALERLRDRLVSHIEMLDREAEATMRKAAAQLRQLLNAKDVEAELQKLLPEMDEAFIVVLSANIQQAEAQGQTEIAELLKRLYVRIMQAMQDNMRPELRTINDLVQVEDEAERQAQLKGALGEYDPDEFIAMMDDIATSLEESGRGDPLVLNRLYALADAARALQAGEPVAAAAPTPPPTKPSSGILLP